MKNLKIKFKKELGFTPVEVEEDKSSSPPFAAARELKEDKSSSRPFAIARELEGSKSVRRNKGFTLIELLIYIGILAIVGGAITSFLLLAIRSNTKFRVMAETLNNSQRAMEIMVYEIRGAKSIYSPTTTENQLSLETIRYLPAGEKTSFIDFYLCAESLCLKKESQNPTVLTSQEVKVTSLIFTQIITGSIPSLQIELEISYKNPENRPEYRAAVKLVSTASLRNY